MGKICPNPLRPEVPLTSQHPNLAMAPQGLAWPDPTTHAGGGGRVGVKTGSPAGWQGHWMVVADSYLDCGLPECRLPVRSVVNASNKK